MKKENISAALNNIDFDMVEDVYESTKEKKKSKKNLWVKWTSLAACFALVAVLSFGVLQSGLFGGGRQIATLDNGNKITFIKSDSATGQLDIAFQIETRALTESEIKTLFNDLPVTAYAVFNAEDDSILGLEGKVNDMKIIVSSSEVSLIDVVIDGEENASDVDGISVNAGYFTSGKKAVYYATFNLGESTVYIEHAGAKETSETVKKEISTMIQKLVELGEINLNQISK